MKSVTDSILASLGAAYFVVFALWWGVFPSSVFRLQKRLHPRYVPSRFDEIVYRCGGILLFFAMVYNLYRDAR